MALKLFINKLVQMVETMVEVHTAHGTSAEVILW